MTGSTMCLRALAKSAHADMLREMISITFQKLMQSEVIGMTSAAKSEKSPA